LATYDVIHCWTHILHYIVQTSLFYCLFLNFILAQCANDYATNACLHMQSLNDQCSKLQRHFVLAVSAISRITFFVLHFGLKVRLHWRTLLQKTRTPATATLAKLTLAFSGIATQTRLFQFLVTSLDKGASVLSLAILQQQSAV
jgi:hypothetical protein